MHIHEWSPTSSHATSQGRVVYLRCTCGAHGVELEGRGAPSPSRRLATVAGDSTPVVGPRVTASAVGEHPAGPAG